MNTRHITRFTYKFTNFQGWRVAITRQGVALARYFSDKQYGDEATSYREAVLFRDKVLAELKAAPEQTQEILMKHRVQPGKIYPAGLKPANASTCNENSSTACSMRSNKVLHSLLHKVCRHLQLDTASVLKLSLYLFTLQYGTAPTMAETPYKTQQQCSAATLPESDTPEAKLHELITELETRALSVGLPSFEEFATGCRPKCQDNNVQNNTPGPNGEMESFTPPAEKDTFPDNYHAAARYMRSPRPSPPAMSPSSTHLPPHSMSHHSHISGHQAHTRDYYCLPTLVSSDEKLPTLKKRQNKKSERLISAPSEAF